MTTETSMPTVDAPADAPVESAAPKEIDEQPSMQLDSASASPSEVPAPAESASPAIETMSQVQDEEDSTGETPAKEGDVTSADAVAPDVARTESLPVDNSENLKGQKIYRRLCVTSLHFGLLSLQIKLRISPRILPRLPPVRLQRHPRTRMIPLSRGSSGRFRSRRSRLFQPRSSRFRSRGVARSCNYT